MRILMLNYEFPPLGGGAGNATYYLLGEFAKMPELEIDLVTSSVKEYKVEKLADNVSVHYLDINKDNQLHYQSARDLFYYTVKAYFYSRKLKKNNKYNICHAFFGIPCGLIAMFLRIPYIVSLRGSDVPFYNKRFYWPDKLIFQHLSRLIWKRAAAVVANSEGLKQLALKTSPGLSIDVIYNGVDTEQFCPLEKKVPEDKIKLISTGRLIDRKGYRYLIEALKDNNQVELTLIGDGNLAEELKKLAIKNNVHVNFTGMVKHEDLPQHLQAADIFVLPSLNEGMSNSVLEAMACGLPVIVTDTGGSKELVRDNGYIVKKTDSTALQRVINNLLNDEKALNDMAINSRVRAKKMDWSKVANCYYETYSKLA